MVVKFQQAALLRLDEIFLYTRDRWGEEQAQRYSDGLFDAIDGLSDGTTRSRPIPAEFNVRGFCFRYKHHFVYWQQLSMGDIGIVSILHEQMHQLSRLREDFGLE
jgi:plasmid stabilization system protein ParE